MWKFALVGLGAAVISAAMGCAITPPGGWVWHPGDPTPARPSDIVGYWAMPIVQTAPEKPGDPPRLVDIRGWIIFLDDGTYQSSTTLDGRTTEETGKWRIRQQFLNYVYLRPNGRDHEGQFTLSDNHGFEVLGYFSIDQPRYAPISLTYVRTTGPAPRPE